MSWEEASVPEVLRRVNTFCENWVFAFLVAMAIRHFCIEAFVIPTASMEPMLYGDPGLFKGDHVVVDKIGHRLTPAERWDVTVFQYPQAERYLTSIRTLPGFDAQGQATQVPFIDPLMHRNFVKRIVGMPGEQWFLRSGNMYIRHGDAPFQVARKPDDLQKVLWLESYRAGAQAGHLPWTGPVELAGDELRFAPGTATFTQPLTNLYLKPGRVRFGRLGELTPPVKPDADQPPVSMVAPLIQIGGERASIWDLDRWQVRRMNSADLDSSTYGTTLNSLMREPVGDWRWRITPTALSGTSAWSIRQTSGSIYELEWSASGWAVRINGREATQATDPAVLGRAWALAVVDDEVQVSRDGAIIWRENVPPWTDLAVRPLVMAVSSGQAWSARVALDRDLHWSHRFLDSEAPEWETQTGPQISYYDQATLGARNAATGAEADQRASLIRQYLTLRLANLRLAMPNGPWPTDEGLDTLALPALMDLMDLARNRVRNVALSPESALTIPEDSYLLLGDNSPHSLDGRAWGYVPAANLRGRALAVVLPPSRWRIVR